MLQLNEPLLHILSVRSLRYPSCNAHAPHCHLRLAPLYKDLSTSDKWHDFRGEKKNVIGHKMFVLIFSSNIVCNISPSEKNWSSCNVPAVLARF